MTLPELIRAIRAQKRWTQVDLAERLGVSVRTVQHWERGATCPDVERIAKCAEVSVTVTSAGAWSWREVAESALAYVPVGTTSGTPLYSDAEVTEIVRSTIERARRGA